MRHRPLLFFRQSFLIFLLTQFFIFDPAISSSVWLAHRQDMVKKEVERKIKKGVDEQELILLQFTKEEAKVNLKWRSPHEFEYNHQLYDIVETATEDDTVFYWCLLDKEEKKLENRLKEAIARALEQKENDLYNPNFLTSWLKPYLFIFSSPWHLPCLSFYALLCASAEQKYASLFSPPPEPPPRFLS